MHRYASKNASKHWPCALTVVISVVQFIDYVLSALSKATKRIVHPSQGAMSWPAGHGASSFCKQQQQPAACSAIYAGIPRGWRPKKAQLMVAGLPHRCEHALVFGAAAEACRACAARARSLMKTCRPRPGCPTASRTSFVRYLPLCFGNEHTGTGLCGSATRKCHYMSSEGACQILHNYQKSAREKLYPTFNRGDIKLAHRCRDAEGLYTHVCWPRPQCL